MYVRYTEWINNFNLCPVLRLSIEEYDLINDPDSVELILEKIEKQLTIAREAKVR
jgi:deoxyadenosine/deoxycytidine kinase